MRMSSPHITRFDWFRAMFFSNASGTSSPCGSHADSEWSEPVLPVRLVSGSAPL